MVIAILSRGAGIYTTRRLAEAARARGHRVRVLDPLQCDLHLDAANTRVLYKGRPLRAPDAVIPRIGLSINIYGLAVLNHFETMGCTLINNAEGIAAARNKMRLMQRLARHGISVPPTVMIHDATRAKDMLELVGGLPVLIKLLQGQEWKGVMVCETEQSLAATMEALLALGRHVVLQQYVRRKKGKDIRALVVGGQVVASVRRLPKKGRFIGTLARGARVEAVRLSEPFERAAVRAAELVGLEVGAVDMLDLPGGPRVFDVHGSPGLKDMEAATGEDLAARVIAHAEARVETERPRVNRATARGVVM
jgi:ribosomal protein S6--L-glutamate ligase